MIQECLKELRLEKNYKQAELAQKLKLTPSTISDWERGRSEPSIAQLIALASIYGCSIDYIAGREGEDGVVVLSGNELSPDEEHLISILRQLPPDTKDTVYNVAELAYDVLKAEEKKKR